MILRSSHRAFLLALPLLATACDDGGGAEAVDPVGQEPSVTAGLPAELPPGVTAEPSVTAWADGAAQIEVDAAQHDFGTVWSGSLLEHVFAMRATGDVPLVIENVKPACSCTVSEIRLVRPDGSPAPYEYGTPIEPGTAFELVAEMETSKLRGRQSKGIQVYANLASGVLSLALTADVRTWLEAQPSVWSVGRMPVTDTRTGEVRVWSGDEKPFRLHVRDDDLPDALVVELEPEGRPDSQGRAKSWSVKLAFGPVETKGRHVYAVPLVSDRPLEWASEAEFPSGNHELRLAVDAQVVGVVTATPAYLSFGMVDADQAISKTVRISCSDPDFDFVEPKVTVTGTEEEPDFLYAERTHVTLRPVEAEGLRAWDVELLLTGAPADVPQAFRGRLLVDTGHPSEEVLAVTFHGFSRGSGTDLGTAARDN